jgi:hypothetical protein
MSLKKLFSTANLFALLLVFAHALSWALPAPKDIEQAVNSRQYDKAEAMLRQVIQEKPNSAKAHYELAEVLALQSHPQQALIEIEQARQIDPGLKFAGSDAQFNQKFEKISQMAHSANSASTATGSSSRVVQAPVPNHESGFPLSYVWIGIGLLIVVALLIRRRSSGNEVLMSAAPAPMAPRGFGAQYAPPVAPGGYPAGYPGGPVGGGGSTMAGAVMGGVAGLAAGYALSKALEGDHNQGHAATGSVQQNDGFVPIDPPAAPDIGGFDPGSGAGWDSSSSDFSDSGGSDDSW